jgi:energy-coupling factor transporter ATP-binding protein EcfA2
MTEPGDVYNRQVIGELMLSAFTVEELFRFLLDSPDFRPIVNRIRSDASLTEMVYEVLNYLETHQLIPELLKEIERWNPRQYARFKQYLAATTEAQPEERKAAFLQRVEISNVRSLRDLVWEPQVDQLPGWHVLIGDNGSGKSTLLQAMALGLVGQAGAEALRENWDNWLTREQPRGHILLDIANAASTEVSLSRRDGAVIFRQERGMISDQGPWDARSSFFSAAYGPFRRFSGGNQTYQDLFKSHPRLAAHLSVFDEGVALAEYRDWLIGLQLGDLQKDPGSELLEYVINFVNQRGLFPHRAQLTKITQEGILFTDGDGQRVSLDDLSDGYRSMLSMTFELIRQMARFYGADGVFAQDDPGKITAPGIVLIDEIDAHLHPTWQREVGVWLCEHFPRVQFIVTTHSPLVCQAAHAGTVYRLPRPGSDERPRMLEGIELDRLRYGNVLDAYGTEAFGDIARSEEAQKLQSRLAELNVKEVLKKGGLSDEERQEQVRLRAILPTSAHTREGAS